MTTNRARARRILESMTNRWGKPATPWAAARALADAGLLSTEPQIIRTREELEALDPDSLALDCTGHLMTNRDRLPAVVIATGEQVRAARQALAEADREPETGDFHSSIGLWQPRPPATWKEA